jgi:hypothetical protein
VKAFGLLVVTDIRLCEKLRYVGVQTSTSRPPDGADASVEASAGALSAPVVASSPRPASLPPELDPLEPLLELLPELLVELPLDPPLVEPDPDDPDDPLDPPLDPLLEPELDPPEEPAPSDGIPCPSLLPQPTAIANAANATHRGRATVDRGTATTTDERIALLLMGGSLPCTPPTRRRNPRLEQSVCQGSQAPPG